MQHRYMAVVTSRPCLSHHHECGQASEQRCGHLGHVQEVRHEGDRQKLGGQRQPHHDWRRRVRAHQKGHRCNEQPRPQLLGTRPCFCGVSAHVQHQCEQQLRQGRVGILEVEEQLGPQLRPPVPGHQTTTAATTRAVSRDQRQWGASARPWTQLHQLGGHRHGQLPKVHSLQGCSEEETPYRGLPDDKPPPCRLTLLVNRRLVAPLPLVGRPVGQPAGHAIRTSLLGRVAAVLGELAAQLSEDRRTASDVVCVGASVFVGPVGLVTIRPLCAGILFFLLRSRPVEAVHDSLEVRAQVGQQLGQLMVLLLGGGLGPALCWRVDRVGVTVWMRERESGGDGLGQPSVEQAVDAACQHIHLLKPGGYAIATADGAAGVWRVGRCGCRPLRLEEGAALVCVCPQLEVLQHPPHILEQLVHPLLRYLVLPLSQDGAGAAAAAACGGCCVLCESGIGDLEHQLGQPSVAGLYRLLVHLPVDAWGRDAAEREEGEDLTRQVIHNRCIDGCGAASGAQLGEKQHHVQTLELSLQPLQDLLRHFGPLGAPDRGFGEGGGGRLLLQPEVHQLTQQTVVI
mmetsp:Transcript_24942/g.71993  ORF Transcript_24942/g.71993 Transcript_24942/m.71993 type:complete len:569 (+) Transcript_24942:1175-2881(+)